MDKTIAGLLGAAVTLVAAAPGHSAPLPPSPETVLDARSYAEVLRPVPDAVATLRAMDEAALAGQGADGRVEEVQLGPIVRDLIRPHHHHHHHHHRYYRRRYHHHHHHHHHHHNGYDR